MRSVGLFTQLDDCQAKLANGNIIDLKTIDNPESPM